MQVKTELKKEDKEIDPVSKCTDKRSPTLSMYKTSRVP